MTQSAGFRRIAAQIATSAVLLLLCPSIGAKAAVKDPVVKEPLAKAVAFLKAHEAKVTKPAHRILMAYSLFKADEPATSPLVANAIKSIQSRVSGGVFTPQGGSESIYSAGVEMMLLADVDAARFRNELEAAAKYVLSQQSKDGSWAYSKDGAGDTSITQYALLGLWSATRSDLDVPLDAWNGAARWLVATQLADGGFAYTPGTTNGPEAGRASPTMTPAAVGSLLVARLHLYPDVPEYGARGKSEARQEAPKKVFGVLEAAEAPGARLGSAQDARSQLTNAVPLNQLDAAIGRGLGMIAARFRPESTNTHKAYYHYTTERVGALINSDNFGSHNWYTSCRDNLISQQRQDGSWKDYEEEDVATALEILFLTRSTGKILKRENSYGSGLLSGGRGIPTDLANADFSGGKLKERKIEGPLDELLGDLTKLNPDNFGDVQAAIVEKIQLGDRSELLGEIDRIRKLISHPDAGIRQTAVWALGRSGDLKDANLLINALQDSNVDVLVESYNALSYLSRKISGVGMPSNPLENLGPNASQAEKDAAVNSWRLEATKRWSTWYLRIRPYADRNDLFQLKFGKKVEKQ